MYIEKLPSGATRVKVSTGVKNEDGKYIYETFTDMDRKKAVRMAAEFMDEHRDTSARDSFKQAMDTYITSSSRRLSPATVREYRSRERTLLTRFPAFCELPVSQITKRRYQEVVNTLAGDLSPKSVDNFCGFISAVIKSQDYRAPIIKLPEAVESNIYVPEVLEVETMVKLAEGTDFEIPILLAAYGTMRCGEICALTLDEIAGNVIHVKYDMVSDTKNRWHIKPPKKKQSDRYIMMPDWIMEKITRGYQKRTGCEIIYPKGVAPDRFVTPWLPARLSTAFVRWIGRYGEHVTMHGLRHFAATDMSDAGIPEAYILARGGWKTDHVMKSSYRTTLKKTQDEVNQSLINRYSKR